MIDETATVEDSVNFAGSHFVGPRCVLGRWGFQHADWAPEKLIGPFPKTHFGESVRLLGFVTVCAGSAIGDRFRVDYGCLVGERCAIGDDVVIEYGARVYDRCIIGDGAVVGGFLCNDSVVGRGAVVHGKLIHSRVVGRDSNEAAPRVGDGAFVGTDALVIGDVVVGEGSFVAAGSIVTSNTEPGFLYAGSPARRRGRTPPWI